MGLRDYIEKLKSKPEEQREKIAVIATGAAFVMIFAIWLVSMSEADKAAEEKRAAPTVDQFDEIKGSIGRDKQSIEDMIKNMPQESDEGNQPENISNQNETNALQDDNSADGNSDKSEVPNLP